MDIGTVIDTVTDTVTDESTGSEGSDGCYGKSYSLLNLEIQLELVEQYTTAMERELEEEENLENNSSRPSQSQDESTDIERSQPNGNQTNEPSPTVTDDDEGLKVGDKVIYVGKKYRESIGNQVMEVVRISVHWTGNQVIPIHFDFAMNEFY